MAWPYRSYIIEIMDMEKSSSLAGILRRRDHKCFTHVPTFSPLNQLFHWTSQQKHTPVVPEDRTFYLTIATPSEKDGTKARKETGQSFRAVPPRSLYWGNDPVQNYWGCCFSHEVSWCKSSLRSQASYIEYSFEGGGLLSEAEGRHFSSACFLEYPSHVIESGGGS